MIRRTLKIADYYICVDADEHGGTCWTKKIEYWAFLPSYGDMAFGAVWLNTRLSK